MTFYNIQTKYFLKAHDIHYPLTPWPLTHHSPTHMPLAIWTHRTWDSFTFWVSHSCTMSSFISPPVQVSDSRSVTLRHLAPSRPLLSEPQLFLLSENCSCIEYWIESQYIAFYGIALQWIALHIRLFLNFNCSSVVIELDCIELKYFTAINTTLRASVSTWILQ